MPSEGFVSLGELIAGGNPQRREAAFLDGLDTGSRINARNASTTNALAQARLRRDEAEQRIGLADAIEAIGGPGELSTVIRSGGNAEQLTGALGDLQNQDLRSGIADVGIPFEQRQANAQAIEGKVVDPFQIQGGLFADVFNPGASPQVAPQSDVDIAATEALARQRNAAAALSDEKRKHPDRFKTGTTVNVGTGGLAEEILPKDGGVSVVPPNFNPEEAFGAESFLKGGANAVSDFIGAGLPFPDQATADNFMSEISARTQIILRNDVPGGRPPVIVQELLGKYAEDPQQLFRGDALARTNLATTLAHMKRSEQRVRDQINSPSKKTPTRQGKLEESLFAFNDLVVDLQAVVDLLDRTHGPISSPTDATQTPNGGSFTVNE